MPIALLLGSHIVAISASNAGSGGTERVASEITAEFMKGFRAFDSDNDGMVDMSMFLRTLRSVGYGQAQPVRRGRGGGVDPFDQFESLDADGDGILRGDEPGPYMRRHEFFKDGEVTLEEFQKAWAELQARRGGRGGGGRGGNRRSGGGGPGGLLSSDVEFLTSLDANRDRRLTVKEARKAITADVIEEIESRTSLDANGDSRVTASEYSLSQPKTGRPVDEDGLDGHARGHFEREDHDRDGVISNAEIAKRVYDRKIQRVRAIQLSLRLAASDGNADGTLDVEELESAGSNALVSALGGLDALPLELAVLYGKLYSASEDEADAIGQAIPVR